MSPLYFAAHGVDATAQGTLFVLWSITSFVCEVPSGALADTIDRRALLGVSGVLYTAGFTSWLLFPAYWGFLAGFVLWGVSSSLMSGTFEALVYDELASTGDEASYDKVRTHAETAAVIAIMAGMLLAGPLLTLGGYRAVGIASVGVAALHTALALLLPPARRQEKVAERHYLAQLRDGLREVRDSPPLRRTILTIAAVVALVAFDEYFSLFFAAAGFSPVLVTVAVAITAAAQALGTALAARSPATNLRKVPLLVALGGAGFVVGALAARTGSLGAGVAAVVLVAAAYGLVTNVYVAQENRLQHQIRGASRATVTSVGGVVGEVGAITSFALVGGLAHWWTIPVVLLVATVPFSIGGAWVARGP